MRLALVLLLLSTSFAGAAPRCAAEAKERAKALLAFHFGEKPDRFAIDDGSGETVRPSSRRLMPESERTAPGEYVEALRS